MFASNNDANIYYFKHFLQMKNSKFIFPCNFAFCGGEDNEN
jgi:hypothetical protein